MIIDELFPIYGAIAGDMIGAPYELKGTHIKAFVISVVRDKFIA